MIVFSRFSHSFNFNFKSDCVQSDKIRRVFEQAPKNHTNQTLTPDQLLYFSLLQQGFKNLSYPESGEFKSLTSEKLQEISLAKQRF